MTERLFERSVGTGVGEVVWWLWTNVTESGTHRKEESESRRELSEREGGEVRTGMDHTMFGVGHAIPASDAGRNARRGQIEKSAFRRSNEPPDIWTDPLRPDVHSEPVSTAWSQAQPISPVPVVLEAFHRSRFASHILESYGLQSSVFY